MNQKIIWKCERGVTLIEVLVGLLLLSAVCLSTLTYFSYGLVGIGQQGHRRAALERARERLEQVLSTSTAQLPARDGLKYWCSAGNPCTTWTPSGAAIVQTAAVDDLASQRMETTAQGVHDASAGTPVGFYDAWEIGVKIWFTSRTNNDDDYNRVYVKTLRAP